MPLSQFITRHKIRSPTVRPISSIKSEMSQPVIFTREGSSKSTAAKSKSASAGSDAMYCTSYSSPKSRYKSSTVSLRNSPTRESSFLPLQTKINEAGFCISSTNGMKRCPGTNILFFISSCVSVKLKYLPVNTAARVRNSPDST